jgi:hypothetical protein
MLGEVLQNGTPKEGDAQVSIVIKMTRQPKIGFKIPQKSFLSDIKRAFFGNGLWVYDFIESHPKVYGAFFFLQLL